MRPWEYWEADSAELYEIAILQTAWRDGYDAGGTEKGPGKT